MLTDNDAEHLAEIIHARRTAARALETSGRALEGGSARARSWSYFPPPRPPQGPPDPAWLGIVTLGRAVPRLCCWGLWGSGTDYARSPILFLWHRVRWSRTCVAGASPNGRSACKQSTGEGGRLQGRPATARPGLEASPTVSASEYLSGSGRQVRSA